MQLSLQIFVAIHVQDPGLGRLVFFQVAGQVVEVGPELWMGTADAEAASECGEILFLSFAAPDPIGSLPEF